MIPTSQQSPHQDLYQNSPLSIEKGQIRLLKLQSGVCGDLISCSLFRTELSSGPTYEALSYTWGTFTDNPGSISLDGHFFRVTRNLYHALQDLRSKSRDTILWIDALCINQEDIKERSEQVRQMTMIYQQASRVVVWLGHSVSQDVRTAVEFLQQWPSSRLGSRDQGKTIHPADHFTDAGQSFSPYMTASQLRGILTIMQRPWFSRGWVVQEITMAKQAIVGFGPLESLQSAWFSWSTLLEADPMQAALNHYNGDIVEFGLATTQLGSMKSLRNAGLRFQDYIRTCQNFSTTDPRDKIYALLGMASDREELDLTPDYTESPQSLFMRTTKAVCRAAGSLDLLTLDVDPKLVNLPSWARDFSSSYTPFVSSGGVFVVLTDIRYAASDGSPPLPRRVGNDQLHQLHITSKPLGRIKHTIPIKIRLLTIDRSTTVVDTMPTDPLHCHPPSHRSDDLEPSSPFHFHLTVDNFEELYHLLQLQTPTETTRDQTIKHLWLILSGGRNSMCSEPVHLGDDCQYGIWRSCGANFEDGNTLGYAANINSMLVYPHRFKHLKSHFEMNTSAFVAPYRASQGRNFFITEDGVVGLCPKAARAGDLIAVVYGASVPFVLRPREGDVSELIGGCYAYGFMDGEALKSSQESKCFVLE